MRTTLTLDEDLYKALRNESRRSGRPFKDVVNDSLRSGIQARRKLRKSGVFKVKPFRMGLRPGLNYDSISELLEIAEGPEHR